MDYLQSLLEYSETPLITAFLLGLLTAVSPLPAGYQYHRHRLHKQRDKPSSPDIPEWYLIHTRPQ